MHHDGMPSSHAAIVKPLLCLSLLWLLLWPALAHAGLPAAALQLVERARARYDSRTATLVADWLQLQDGLASADIATQLEKVNGFFNRRLRFADDIDIWRQQDYWATPFETMSKRAGDCEDFAIAKYITLRRLGISDDRLRLIYVRARIGGAHSSISQAHMVLGYFPSAEADPLILDNLISDIRPGQRRPDLSPVFSFNSAGLWVGAANNPSADPTARLSRWRDLFTRMKADGLELNR